MILSKLLGTSTHVAVEPAHSPQLLLLYESRLLAAVQILLYIRADAADPVECVRKLVAAATGPPWLVSCEITFGNGTATTNVAIVVAHLSQLYVGDTNTNEAVVARLTSEDGAANLLVADDNAAVHRASADLTGPQPVSADACAGHDRLQCTGREGPLASPCVSWAGRHRIWCCRVGGASRKSANTSGRPTDTAWTDRKSH